ncbi:LOW QUALITY PROTEIN: olfactory receptor 187-like [Acanthochromis polyacanthus]|uniref:LOW QUALITY PROTEIN: olfactory receptor 187-like n=1 Tax=Acanthochromis polyacanthus TaxID=80966 RepID=UPI0022342B5A|nr:LOW QUALITY PROTEIN: olfactory receptor 187-like [Acanthochromis polyacanthus]
MDQMNVEFNVTYLTFSGHVELHKFRYLYFLVMFIVYVLIFCSNSIILCIIWVHKSLHEPMYIFIAALLLNSILFSTNIYPKLLIDFLSDKQVITHSHCVFQFFAYYSLGSSEFLLLSAMAYDRYVSICKPLQYPNIMRKTTVSVLLLLAWLVPALQVMPTVAMSNDLHLLVLMSTSSLCSYDVIIARLQVYLPSTGRLIMTLQLIIYHPLFNPLIYGVKMKEISKHLKKLLCEGLSEAVTDELASMDEPATLGQLISLSTGVDNRLQEHHQERGTHALATSVLHTARHELSSFPPLSPITCHFGNTTSDALSQLHSAEEAPKELEPILISTWFLVTLSCEIESKVRQVQVNQPHLGKGLTNNLFVPDSVHSVVLQLADPAI